jgi:hypothetical protein
VLAGFPNRIKKKGRVQAPGLKNTTHLTCYDFGGLAIVTDELGFRSMALRRWLWPTLRFDSIYMFSLSQIRARGELIKKKWSFPAC